MGDLLRKQVRQRMADDMATQLRLLKSEVEHYGEYFSAAERVKLQRLGILLAMVEKFCRK